MANCQSELFWVVYGSHEMKETTQPTKNDRSWEKVCKCEKEYSLLSSLSRQLPNLRSTR